MVVLDGRCLCVGTCCCLNLPTPSNVRPVLNSRHQLRRLDTSKANSQSSMTSEVSTRADDRSSRSSGASSTRSESFFMDSTCQQRESDPWHSDSRGAHGISRIRRFEALPSDEDAANKQGTLLGERRQADADAAAKRREMRRKFLDDECSHF
eukprot:TRINITY_DN82857_c0_g1_i1.p1 TRINITY_DN82857_c0_g1~~TRINITY_DN82857_c0_g1_i1.p1  ORF type:complete len:152 (-),score=17.46 TRINITY_DN82857_c0_g1_i1:135-590(-)